MFRISVITFTILLASCGDTLAQAPAPSGVAVPIAAATPASVISEGSREIDRWMAICRRDLMDFLDNREYCLAATPLVDEDSREIDRWIAICRRDPMDFLDNREYCLRIGPWESAITPR